KRLNTRAPLTTSHSLLVVTSRLATIAPPGRPPEPRPPPVPRRPLSTPTASPPPADRNRPVASRRDRATTRRSGPVRSLLPPPTTTPPSRARRTPLCRIATDTSRSPRRSPVLLWSIVALPSRRTGGRRAPAAGCRHDPTRGLSSPAG